MTKSFLKPVLLVGAVVLVPLLAFAILGRNFEADVERRVREDIPPSTRFTGIVLVLASDILLPIPSSAVSTYAGGVLGFTNGFLASLAGMTAGACLGFALARRFGRRFTTRFATGQDLHGIRSMIDRYGSVVLLVTRALPILAEACVLLTGTTQLAWRQFLVPVVLGNALVSAVYCACGVFAHEQNSLVVVAIVSGSIPLAVALLARRRLWRQYTRRR